MYEYRKAEGDYKQARKGTKKDLLLASIVLLLGILLSVYAVTTGVSSTNGVVTLDRGKLWASILTLFLNIYVLIKCPAEVYSVSTRLARIMYIILLHDVSGLPYKHIVQLLLIGYHIVRSTKEQAERVKIKD